MREGSGITLVIPKLLKAGPIARISICLAGPWPIVKPAVNASELVPLRSNTDKLERCEVCAIYDKLNIKKIPTPLKNLNFINNYLLLYYICSVI